MPQTSSQFTATDELPPLPSGDSQFTATDTLPPAKQNQTATDTLPPEQKPGLLDRFVSGAEKLYEVDKKALTEDDPNTWYGFTPGNVLRAGAKGAANVLGTIAQTGSDILHSKTPVLWDDK